jgi:hypothetical protein
MGFFEKIYYVPHGIAYHDDSFSKHSIQPNKGMAVLWNSHSISRVYYAYQTCTVTTILGGMEQNCYLQFQSIIHQ